MSKDAKQVFQKWQHQLKRQELRETNGTMELVYPKMESYTAAGDKLAQPQQRLKLAIAFDTSTGVVVLVAM